MKKKNMSDLKPLIIMVEDDEDMARLTGRLLSRDNYEVLLAFNAKNAKELMQNHKPDLLILDIMLPDSDGITLCEELRNDSDAPVLFLTGKRAPSDKVEGLRAGGDYYLTKPYNRDEFLAVVGSLLRRESETRKKIKDATELKRGTLTLLLAQSKALVNGLDANLTPKEFSILYLLMLNENKELNGETIYKKIWNTDAPEDLGTVRQHISRLKKKLNEENTDDFSILNKPGQGYMFTTE
jgi:DNA-binding response OmpR family regulator